MSDQSSAASEAAEQKLREKVSDLKSKIQLALNKKADGYFSPASNSDKGHGLNRVSKMKVSRTLEGHRGHAFAADWGGANRPEALVTVGQAGHMFVWNAKNALKTKVIRDCSFMMCVALEKAKSDLIAISGVVQEIRLYSSQADENNYIDDQPLKVLSCHQEFVSCVRFVPGSEDKMLSTSGDGSMCLINIEKEDVERRLVGHYSDVMSVAVHETNPNVVVTGGLDDTCKLWDLRAQKNNGCVMTYQGHEDDINSVKFFPSGMAFASASEDCTSRLFDIRAHQELNTYRADNIVHPITDLCFSHSGALLFSHNDYKLIAWNTISNRNERYNIGSKPKDDHKGKICQMAMQHDGKALATCSWDSKVKIWA